MWHYRSERTRIRGTAAWGTPKAGIFEFLDKTYDIGVSFRGGVSSCGVRAIGR